MKKLLTVLSFLFITAEFTVSQDLKQVLLDRYYPIDFIGLDFSEVKLIGVSSDYASAYELTGRFFSEWNEMFYSQPEKFDVGTFLRKHRVHYSTENMISVNDKVDANELISRRPTKEFTKVKLQEIINNYNFEFENEVAMVFVINSLDKPRKQTKLNVVFFNTNSKNILFSTQIVTEPAGGGFRNYWIGSIYYALKELKNNEYKKWKKLYK